jgi:putative flippase GtrA
MIRSQIKIFIIIGILNTIVGLSSVYIMFNILGLNYWPSTLLGNGIAMLLSYFLNRKFTFRNKAKAARSFLKFFIVVIACYYSSYWLGFHVSNLVLSPFITDSKVIGNISILLGAGLYTISNFLGQKFIVFNKAGSDSIRKLGVK